jgi:hypothetical protein
VPHTVFAGEDALDNVDNSLMPLRGLRSGGSFCVCRGDIRKQVARILCADDFEIRQRKKERLAYPKGSHALGIIETCGLCHVGIPFDCEPIASQGRQD